MKVLFFFTYECLLIIFLIQIISQDSIMELGRCRDSIRMSDHMRSLALSVFMQCRRHLIHTNNIKSLTGFGTAANAELFLKSKDVSTKQIKYFSFYLL